MDNQLANPAFSVEQLADELAVSPRTLHRKLATLTGSNAAELMRAYRLRKAAGFLQAGASVSEAAEKAGFESLSHFSRSFKAQFAVSPSAYGSPGSLLGQSSFCLILSGICTKQPGFVWPKAGGKAKLADLGK